MLDFLIISTRIGRRGATEIYPKFAVKKSEDLMIRGGDFYAIWVEELGLWSTNEQDAVQLIDNELDIYVKQNAEKFAGDVKVMYMWDSDSGRIDAWHKYCQKQMRDNFHMLDEKLIFSNVETKKKDYASKRLSYPLEKGPIPAFDKLMSTLYSEKERHKIEWAIGAIVSGESKKLQKFMVLYGAAGTGKSTVLNIIQQLFEGYYSVFDARALGSSSNSFALEAFKTNPLVSIQHDGDLSKIEDNTRLNSLVSHEMMSINEKFKTAYANKFKSFLFMGTNKPVKITDAKSGVIRRLIDVSPSGNKLNAKEYKDTTKQVTFELGAIAYHCQEVYLRDSGAYDNYIPTIMLGASNDFYNYVIDSYHIFKREDGTTLKTAWEMYKVYCEEAKVSYPLAQRAFKEELKNYFWEFNERLLADDGSRIRSYYKGFRTDKFETEKNPEEEIEENKHWLKLESGLKSIFDKDCSECFAQYANDDGAPIRKWENVTTKLADIDTGKLHYVKVPGNHIIIDFDLKDEKGEKSVALNIAAASAFPRTYAELSKSGGGLHLHYIYSGDVSTLSRVYDDGIEVKIATGNSSIRRKLTKCNDLPIATIASGLPLKGDKIMLNKEVVFNEKAIRTMIKRNLNKEYHSATKPSIDYICKILDDMYESGTPYDVSDLKNAVLAFAAESTNQADYCIKLCSKMHFKSENISEPEIISNDDDSPLIFFDVEVFPNLFLVNWKTAGENVPVVRMINPKPSDIEELFRHRLVGFNCRRYDNHILYACYIGYSNEELFQLSKRIITSKKGDKNSGMFGEAYNISYTDVYDFAATKQSLKKWEIELGIHHQELGLPWDKPVPEEKWIEVAEYCDNDVMATEAVFNHLQADFTARKILADVAGLSVNDTTNSLTTRIIFGTNKKPQDQFNYRDMGDTSQIFDPTEDLPWYVSSEYDEFTVFDKENRPIFPGYKYESGISTYRGEEVGEGGYVYSEPGMYTNIALLDIASMHPSSIVAERLFGGYTDRFFDILNARIAIKHKEFDRARQMLGGALAKYLTDENAAKDLSKALKIAINSVYGLTAANFDNPFHDRRNRDNIVAKRGALFMVNLKHEVQKRGFSVAHIKTDSIKIPNATPEIIKFVMDYGAMYGYTFEHEATYERMCLVNDAVYICKYSDGHWDATGTQFAVPYVFKTLFSKELIEFEDMCETKSVTSSLYLDMNENLPDVADLEKNLDKFIKRCKDAGIDPDLSGNSGDEELDGLINQIADGHNYIFIGKVGLFCPIKPGCNGGLLMREKDGKYYAATGSKGYRWLEAETVKSMEKEADIDKTYYNNLVDAAVDAIQEHGDFEWFVSDDPIPPWFAPDDSNAFAVR